MNRPEPMRSQMLLVPYVPVKYVRVPQYSASVPLNRTSMSEPLSRCS